MKKISIVIPVYNVEPYIRKSLDSVIHQTYSNLEIICVDDGSTDASGVICDEYASNDPRIKVVHQKNSGNSAAMNSGLKLVTGEYLGFVDPDDWIELDYYEAACNAIEQYEVDMVCTGWYKETVDQSAIVQNKVAVESRKVSRKQILEYTFRRDTYPAFGAYYWNKLFRAELFQSSQSDQQELRFYENMKVGADVVLFVEYTLRANSAVYFEKPYYHYFQRETSLFHSKDIEKRKDSLVAYAKVIELLERQNTDLNIIVWVKRFYVYHASLMVEIALHNGDKQNLLFMQNEIKRYLTDYIDTNLDFPDRLERINKLLAVCI